MSDKINDKYSTCTYPEYVLKKVSEVQLTFIQKVRIAHKNNPKLTIKDNKRQLHNTSLVVHS